MVEEGVEPAGASFQKDLLTALFAEGKSSKILRLLEYLVSDALMLSEAREELKEAISKVEHEQKELEAAAELVDASAGMRIENSIKKKRDPESVDEHLRRKEMSMVDEEKDGDYDLQNHLKSASDHEESKLNSLASEEKTGEKTFEDTEHDEAQNDEAQTCAHAKMPRERTESHDAAKHIESGKGIKGEERKISTLADAAAAPRTTAKHASATVYVNQCAKFGIPVSAIFTKCVDSSSSDLNFSHYGLSEEGLTAVTMALASYSNLTSLDLADNCIGPDGAAIVGSYLAGSNLLALNLAKNSIGLVRAFSFRMVFKRELVDCVCVELNLHDHKINSHDLPCLLSQTSSYGLLRRE